MIKVIRVGLYSTVGVVTLLSFFGELNYSYWLTVMVFWLALILTYRYNK